MANIEIDQKLDYKQIFTNLLKKNTITGDQILGSCPLHEDKRASFSANLKNGVCQCFSCGFKGNYINLYAQLNNCDTKEAYKRICEENNISLEEQPEPAKKKEPEKRIYTLDQYSQEKHLERDFLEQVFKLSEYKAKNGNVSVKIPYFAKDGSLIATRYRHSPKSDPRFTWQKGSKVCLYGLQFMEAIKAEGSVILVEGESDAQTLIRLGFKALGVPGASTLNSEAAKELQGLNIYIHVEPDNGGQLFLNKCAQKLREAGINEIYRFSCSELGEKDPSALYIRDNEKAGDEIQSLLDNAQKVEDPKNEIEATITGAPINLLTPDGYYVNDEGISTFDQDGNPRKPFLTTPILISKLVNNLEHNELKLKISVKRNNNFNDVIISRSDLTPQNIIKVATATGAIISSANAKQVIQYLTDLEGSNKDIIPTGESVERFGWIDGDRFLPYRAENIDLEFGDPRLANACTARGSLGAWSEAMSKHRDRYIFRFILASSFAAPLLKPLQVRSFVVYNWADSRGGKTAALKAALSVWGDPEALKMTFNSTRNFLEGKAVTMCDLPLGIDERQQATNPADVAQLFYMLGNETQRGRMSKNLSVQALKTWRTVAIATGEEPAAGDSTMDGCRNRMIELIGAPFENMEDEALKMHQTCADNCGNAGEIYINSLVEMKKKHGLKGFIDLYKSFISEIEKIGNLTNLAHASMLATVATADLLSSMIVFGEEYEDARSATLAMLQNVIRDIKENQVPDVNITACADLFDFYQANKNNFFSPELSKTLYGFDDAMAGQFGAKDQPAKNLYIFPKYLKEILEAKYSSRKTLEFMAKNGILVTDKKGGKCVQKWSPATKQNVRVYNIKLQKLREIVDIGEQDNKEEDAKQNKYFSDEAEIAPF